MQEDFSPFSAGSEERHELELIINEVCRAAKTALYDPRNISKGGWKDCDQEYIEERTGEEITEFFDDIYDGKDEHAAKEGGDVLNFMAMAIHNVRRGESEQ